MNFIKVLEEYYYNFLKFADKQVDIQIDILNVLRSLTDKKKNENIDIRKDISNLSRINFKIYFNCFYTAVNNFYYCSAF